MNETSSKAAWWAGFKAALNLPSSATNEEALRVKAALIGDRALMQQEAANLAACAIRKATGS